jgi:serine/threonine protein kinase
MLRLLIEITCLFLLISSGGSLLYLLNRLSKRVTLGREIRALGDFVTGVVPSGPLPMRKKGTFIDSYKVVSELGRGGMGTVFKATDPGGQDVAIKVIGGLGIDRKARVSESYRMALVREARLAAELRHPNIVGILDIGQVKGTLYVVMEYLDGMSLDQHIRKRSLDVRLALSIAADLCEALDYAHKRHIVHRDIKPANIFITSTGRVKVLDFGLARPYDGLDALGFAGTPAYMSPEQIRGKPLDGRTDIWSVGITLYEMLAGEVPFRGRNLRELSNKILTGDLRELPASIPLDREPMAILKRAVATDRDERYATAGDFARDLRSLANRTVEVFPGIQSGNNFGASERLEPERYASVDLGLKGPSRAQVILTRPDSKGGWSELFRANVFLWGTIGLIGLSIAGRISIGEAFYGLVAVALLTYWILVPIANLAERFIFPTKFYRCRSCTRRMHSTTAWKRAQYSIEKDGLCVADCLAALKAGIWEEAVKLLWIHTSEGQTDTRYWLEFFECSRCWDQRAYFKIEKKKGPTWDVESIREAYRSKNAIQPQKSVRRLISKINTLPRDLSEGDIHGRTTL